MTLMAAIQFCATASVDENLQSIATLTQKAVQQGARLIVLPENAALMGAAEHAKLEISEIAGEGRIQAFLSQLAKQHQVWIVGGTLPIKSDQPGKVFAASFLFNDQGECVARYDKIHLFDVAVTKNEVYCESNTIAPGNKIVVHETPFGKIGMAVCYDLRFPELFRCMLLAGADFFVLPSAFTQKTGAAHWHVLTRARAIENTCYLIGAGQGGQHANGRETYGHSLIVNPWGEILAEAGEQGEAVVVADIDIAMMQEIRSRLPMRSHVRLKVGE